MERIIFHIDVNNAFLSWSAVYMLKNGYKKDIREEVSVIGGSEEERRGIVLAKSPIAKRFGIVTAESLYSARKKCKGLKVYPPNFEIYSKYSNLMYEYLCNYSSSIERYSIDECFVDYTESVRLFGDPIKLAYKIKEDIKNNFGFTVNVGVGNNKLCAKMASDFSKPDKVHTLFMNEIEEKMWPLAVNDLLYIGKSTTAKLKEMGINTIGDLAHTSEERLRRNFKNQTKFMMDSARGIDNSSLERESEPKSISSSTVLPFDYSNLENLEKIIRNLSLEVGRKLRKYDYFASVITVFVKYGSFERISKQKKLDKAINSDSELYGKFLSLFNEMWNHKPIRSIGVGVKDFSTVQSLQLSLIGDNEVSENKNNKSLQEAVDSIRKKFGNESVIYGDMIEKN